MAINTRKLSETELVEHNWSRFQYGKVRGHSEYIDLARKNEDFYLGGGKQWRAEDRAYLESIGRPAIEINHIFPAVNTAKGMQIKSRVDISFKPRGAGADEQTAEVLSKVVHQITDEIKYQWLESQAFEDGLIQQRGYLDFRVEFDESMHGDITCKCLDPMDVVPDPDAQDYEPDTWQDVVTLRWMTIDDIEQLYGAKKAIECEQRIATRTGSEDEEYPDRSRFGNIVGAAAEYDSGITEEAGLKRVLVVDRQWRRLEMQKAVVHPVTGKIIPTEGATPEQIAKLLAEGAYETKRKVRKIRWTVTTRDILLHDDWSPYKTFTIVPYFPYFRRGRTTGMVDNMVSPQEANNKLVSQFVHIVSGVANTGWNVEQGSLTNMRTADLEDYGSRTGLVIEYAKGSAPPQKIQPTQMPQGIDRMIDRAEFACKTVSGMSDAVQGLNGPEVSGVAIQSKQYQGQSQLGGPLDNLSRTRYTVARKLLELVQNFYTEERVMMITDAEDITQQEHEELVVNQQLPDGTFLNDLTVGEYDVVVTDSPTTDTYLNSQFNQAMEMREKGIMIPDLAVIEMSNLSKKHEIASMMQEQAGPPPDPETEVKVAERGANAKLKEAQAEKVRADTVASSVTGMYSAMQAAGVITQDPATAPLADKLLLSAGFEDKDAPPIVPGYAGAPSEGVPAYPPNTDPMTPAPTFQADAGAAPNPMDRLIADSPGIGQAQGIETQRID